MLKRNWAQASRAMVIAPTTPNESQGDTSAAPAPAPSASSRSPEARGDDRTVMGGSVRVAAGELVHNVVVYGGNVDVLGTVVAHGKMGSHRNIIRGWSA